MIAETGVAFGGAKALEVFTWLTKRQSSRMGASVAEESWLMHYARQCGWSVVWGSIRPKHQKNKIKTTAAVWLERDAWQPNWASLGLEVVRKQNVATLLSK